jgi:hypothetical protein
MEDVSQHLLDVVFERFARTGEWPVVDRLRHERLQRNRWGKPSALRGQSR